MVLGGDTKPLLLVTARHVVFPPSTTSNDKFERRNTNDPRSDVLLLDDKAYGQLAHVHPGQSWTTRRRGGEGDQGTLQPLQGTVIKKGSTTGTTIGRASGIVSFVREYFDDDSHKTSKEWAILPYDNKSDAFPAPGDSSAVVVDGLG